LLLLDSILQFNLQPTIIPVTKTTIMLTTQNTKHSQSSFIPFIALSKTFSKFSLVLIVLANISPALAASKYQNASLSNQKLEYPDSSQKTMVAGWINDVIKTVDTVDRTNDRIQRRERQRRESDQRARERKIKVEMQQREREQILQERQAREEERKRRQEELAAARKAATEKQIQEAERRRQYFDSLSPEQKQAYVKQQQALRQKQAEAVIFLLGLGLMYGGGGSSSQQQTTEYRYIYNTPAPTNNSTPAPVTPIGGNSGIFGDCHHAGCSK
jgi:hypothetical protein